MSNRLIRITHAQWPGNVFVYQVPEHVLPTADRRKILPNEPETDEEDGSVKF